LATNTSQSTVWFGGFGPYGPDYFNAHPSNIRLRLPGQIDDPIWRDSTIETPLYYNVHRWYEPTTGRYTVSDPLHRALMEEFIYAYAESRPTFYIDPLGLAAGILCRRCQGSGGSMSCSISEDEGPPGISFPVNVGTNADSITPGDPYGTFGPLPSGCYDLPNAYSPKFGRPLPSPTNTGVAGVVTTGAGTRRDGIRVHRGTRSEGCITTGSGSPGASREAGLVALVNEHQATGGTRICILDVDCVCETCPLSKTPGRASVPRSIPAIRFSGGQ
jgi:RHS repeat-associated protein